MIHTGIDSHSAILFVRPVKNVDSIVGDVQYIHIHTYKNNYLTQHSRKRPKTERRTTSRAINLISRQNRRAKRDRLSTIHRLCLRVMQDRTNSPSHKLALHTKAVPCNGVCVSVRTRILILAYFSYHSETPRCSLGRYPVKSPPLIVTETVGELMLYTVLSADRVYYRKARPILPSNSHPSSVSTRAKDFTRVTALNYALR